MGDLWFLKKNNKITFFCFEIHKFDCYTHLKAT
jgi:hypothetical protein